MESQTQIMSCPAHNIPQLVSLMVRRNKGAEQARMGSRVGLRKHHALVLHVFWGLSLL